MAKRKKHKKIPPKEVGLLPRAAIKRITKSKEDMAVFDGDIYMSFVVTDEERAIIEDALAKYTGRTLTEQLLCLIKTKKK